MPEAWVAGAVIGSSISGGLGVLIGSPRGMPGGASFLLGAVLGPLGWLVLAIVPRDDAGARERLRMCPLCADHIEAAAVRCRHCGADLATAGGGPAEAWPDEGRAKHG